MDFVNLLLVLLITLVICGIFLFPLLRDSVRGKGRWGVNLKSVSCPKCGESAPQIRTPTSLRQAAWGGWTCGSCGREMDKWGAEVTRNKPNA